MLLLTHARQQARTKSKMSEGALSELEALRAKEHAETGSHRAAIQAYMLEHHRSRFTQMHPGIREAVMAFLECSKARVLGDVSGNHSNQHAVQCIGLTAR